MMKSSIRFVIPVVLVIITALPAAASPDLGSSPYAAQPLSVGLNIGTLAPGEDFWYAFSGTDLGDQPANTAVLNMVYRPGSHDVAAYVNFQLLTQEQADRWLQGQTDQYMALGTYTTTDFDQETAERLWSGNINQDQTYYIHIFNNSRQPVEYHLTALGEPEMNANPATSVADEPATRVIPAVALESSPDAGATLEETQWLLVAAALHGMSTPDAAAWLMMANRAGWLPATDPGTVARASDSYAAGPGFALERAAVVEIAEAPSTEVEAAPEPASSRDLYPSVYPTAPLALSDGVNVGKLAPGGEHWYSFIREDRDTEWFEFMPMTLFSTPTDGNTSHHINFQLFTGSQLQIWERGTPEDMVPMGAGQWVSRDKDPVTGERLWAGHVIDGDLYYVRIFNNSDEVIDYYLITNDVTNTELGDRVWAANPTYRRTLYQPSGSIRIHRQQRLE
jgi:hypothetical protein